MRNHIMLLGLLASLTASGCKQVECADGTVERDGRCEPATAQFDDSMCGPFTVLQGSQCVPQFPPTECDPATTQEDVDPATGVTTCIGTGGGGCSAAIACPAGSSGTKQTICGQLYDFETNEKFAAAGATGAPCDVMSPTASGPCALTIRPYDAIAFGTNPQTAQELTKKSVYVDDCGRYRVEDIDVPSGPFIGLGIDDVAGLGPTGVSVTAAVATPKAPMSATKDLEAWMVKPSTAQAWATSGGPTLTTGIYAPVFRKHKVTNNADPMAFIGQEGVTVTLSGNPVPNNDFYFPAADTGRSTIDAAATMTGVNGTVFVNNASVTQSVNWGGMGGLGAGCRWEPHAGASLPGIVFIQVFRKLDVIGQTCMD